MKWRKKMFKRSEQMKKNLFLRRWFYTIYEQKFSNLRPFFSITFPPGFRKCYKFGHWTLGSGGKKTVKRSEKYRFQKKSCSLRQNSPKNKLFLHSNFTPFIRKIFQIWDHFFPLLFAKDSQSVKCLEIWFREMGAKRGIKSTSKVNRHTRTRTHERTFRLIESINTEGRCFENW